MENNTEIRKIADAAYSLESIRAKLEYLTGVTKVCAVAYEQKGVYGSISEEDTANAFFEINSELQELTSEVNNLVSILSHSGAEKVDVDESETI